MVYKIQQYKYYVQIYLHWRPETNIPLQYLVYLTYKMCVLIVHIIHIYIRHIYNRYLQQHVHVKTACIGSYLVTEKFPGGVQLLLLYVRTITLKTWPYDNI